MIQGAGLFPPVVRFDLEARNRNDVLRALVRSLREAGAVTEEDEPFRRLVERESLQSTALGGGVALPHARTPACGDLRLAVARLATAVDFEATDSIPVDLVFLVLGPPGAPAEHLRLLGRITTLLRRPDAVDALRAAVAEEGFREVLEREL